jgi:hypothetical protein
MIDIFPRIYKDELLYSILARYHSISGNVNLKDTLKSFFDVESVIPVIDFQCNLDKLAKKLHSELKLDSDYFIKNCSLFPVYAPFLPEKRRDELINTMKRKNGSGLKHKVGIIAGGICKKKQLYYCPLCAKEEISKFGEAYFHRLHQVQGVLVCENHKCLLKPYKCGNYLSRLEYISMLNTEIDLVTDTIKNQHLLNQLIHITSEVKFLFDNNLDYLNQEIVHEKYLVLLRKRGLLTINGRINQMGLYTEFTTYYGEELLEALESNIEMENEYNWLKIITRKPKRVSHPIRHLLLIDFLCGSIEQFISMGLENKNPFIEGPFPCLNPSCVHYKELVIRECKVTADYKTREPVGTFTCECGFIYSRKVKDDIYKIGRIKNFGGVWEKKLAKLIEGSNSIRAIAKEMKCDCKTVIKYADKLGLKESLNTRMDIKYFNFKRESLFKIDSEKYRDDIKKAVDKNPEITRNKIKGKLYKQYMWLYRNDRDWFEEHMPKMQNREHINYSKDNNDMWLQRDSEVLELLKREYDMLINEVKPIRITKSILGRRIGKLSYIEKCLDKLPKTKDYLESICQSIEDFQIRRIDKVCMELNNKGEQLVRWKIVRMAGLKNNLHQSVIERIEYYINEHSVSV